MADNALGGDVQWRPIQLGKAPRLDVVDSQEPLVQRQMPIESHLSSAPSYDREPLGSPLEKAPDSVRK